LGLRLRGFGPFRKRAAPEELTEDVVEESVPTQEDLGPPLMVLVPHASGTSSFCLQSFPDAGCAADFIRSRKSSEGVVAFWALHRRPNVEAERAPECIVIVRDGRYAEVGFPISFVDMESAQSTARAEIREGLNPGHLLVYWALPVAIDIDARGSVLLSPSVPPKAVRHAPPAVPTPEADFERPRDEEVQTEREALLANRSLMSPAQIRARQRPPPVTAHRT
jgi:hypothetical protein